MGAELTASRDKSAILFGRAGGNHRTELRTRTGTPILQHSNTPILLHSSCLLSAKRRSNYFVADLSRMRDHAPFQDFVRQVEVKCIRAFVPEVFDECGHIVGVHFTGICGDTTRQMGEPNNPNAVDFDLLVVLRTFDISTGLHGGIDDHASGSHLS